MIRYLEPFEKQQIRQLYEQSFHDTKEYMDYYFTHRILGAYVAVKEKERTILSTLQLIPKSVIVGTFKSTILYIYGACTAFAYRNQGFMNELFQKVLKDMYFDMEPFTYLIPSDENNAQLYEKYGFAYVMDKHQTKPEHQRRKPIHSLISRHIENSDLVRLSIFAQDYTARKYDVTMCKDVEYFKNLKELVDIEGGYIEILIENKVIVGYRVLINDEILEEVLDDSVSNTVSWLEPEKKPYVMARILNLRNMMRRLTTKSAGQVLIRLSDPMIDENNGCFLISCKDRRIHLQRMKDDEIANDTVCDITIGELTMHIFGYQIIEDFPTICVNNGFYINDYV